MALSREKKTLKQLKKAAKRHRGTVKSLKADLDQITTTRMSVISEP
jgi:hypothetical protein